MSGVRMVERLLRSADGLDLVGIGPDAERSIYYELASRSLVAVRFDKHGVDATGRELLRRGLDDPTAWVGAYGDGLALVHPRYAEWVGVVDDVVVGSVLSDHGLDKIKRPVGEKIG